MIDSHARWLGSCNETHCLVFSLHSYLTTNYINTIGRSTGTLPFLLSCHLQPHRSLPSSFPSSRFSLFLPIVEPVSTLSHSLVFHRTIIVNSLLSAFVSPNRVHTLLLPCRVQSCFSHYKVFTIIDVSYRLSSKTYLNK